MPRKKGDHMVLISVHVPKRILETIDSLVREGILPNRSEAIRMALLMLLEWKLFSKGPDVMPKPNVDPTEKAFRALLVKGR
jgi:hypothetical protein